MNLGHFFDFDSPDCYITNRYVEKDEYEKNIQILDYYSGDYLAGPVYQGCFDKSYYGACSGICTRMGIDTCAVFNGTCDRFL